MTLSTLTAWRSATCWLCRFSGHSGDVSSCNCGPISPFCSVSSCSLHCEAVRGSEADASRTAVFLAANPTTHVMSPSIPRNCLCRVCLSARNTDAPGFLLPALHFPKCAPCHLRTTSNVLSVTGLTGLTQHDWDPWVQDGHLTRLCSSGFP